MGTNRKFVRWVGALVVCSLCLVANNVKAEEKQKAEEAPEKKAKRSVDKPWALGVEGAFVLPLGGYARTGIGLGGMAKGAYNITDEMSVALRVGYIYHLDKEYSGIDGSLLPILMGFRYTMHFGLFGELSLGLATGEFSNWDVHFGLLAGAGFTISGLTFGVNYFAPSIRYCGEIMGLFFVVGYDFITF